MSATKCLFRPSYALARVFAAQKTAIDNAAGSASQLRHLLLPAVYTTAQPSRRLLSSTAPSLRGGRGPSRPSNKGPSTAASNKNRLPRDSEITHKFVQIRGEDGRLSEPQPTSEVLASLDPRVSSLRVIALPRATTPGDGEESGPSEVRYPICRVVDREAERTAAVEKAKAERKKAVGSKEVEINWAIAPHDLQTKLRQLKGFLGKGLKVQVLLLSKAKRNKRMASRDEAKEVLRQVKEAIGEVPGSKEVKGMEGAVGGQARLFLQGPQGDVSP